MWTAIEDDSDSDRVKDIFRFAYRGKMGAAQGGVVRSCGNYS